MFACKAILLFGLIFAAGRRVTTADDVNEDLCGRIDLDGPVQAIQYKLESLYSAGDAETDATVAEIKSNFDDLTRKADKISDDCERKTPKLLGFINQMNQAKQCTDALNGHKDAEAQNECQAVHDEAKLNFIVRTVVNDSEDYNQILKCANTFTDLVQRVKMYRAILREEDKGDEESNRKFYETVKQLMQEKNAPSNALRDILKTIARRSVLDKDLKFTDMELMKDLHDYDDGLGNAAVTELVTQLYNQNNYTATHLLFMPLVRSRVAAVIALYNKSNDHINDNLAKNIHKVIYITRLHPDYKTVDVNSKKQIDGIYKSLANARQNLKTFGMICVTTNEFNETYADNNNEEDKEAVMIRADSKDDNMEEWKFKTDDKGNVLLLNLDGNPRTKLFISKDEYADDELALLGDTNRLGKWNKMTMSDICSIKDSDKEQYICTPGSETGSSIFGDSNMKARKLLYEARIKARETICAKA